MVYHQTMTSNLQSRYTLAELADLTGVTPRTVRYYVSQGLLAVDVTPGPGPKYTDAHLARLRLIKRLQREHLPLAEIRMRLASVDDETIQAIDVEAAPVTPSESALAYIQRISGGRRTAEPHALYSRGMEGPAAPAPSMPGSTPPAARLERSQWERVDLAPDIELHIRRPLSRPAAKQVDRLIQIARDLFREES